jgi:hypothetical protein
MVDMSELYGVYVDQALADEVNTKPFIRTGTYTAVLKKPRIDVYPNWSDGAGLPRLNIGVVLYEKDGTRLGTKFVDVCPVIFESFGSVSLDSKRFAQVASAIGMLQSSVGEIIDAIDDAIVMVFGKEFFKIPVALFPEEERAKLVLNRVALEKDRKCYLKTKDDALRERLLDAGYKSDFAVFSFMKAENQPTNNDEISG